MQQNELIANLQQKLRQQQTEIETLRAQHDEELARTQSVITAMFNAVVDGILVVDLDGNIVTANLQFRTMWGIPPEITQSDEALKYVRSQLADPEQFYKRAREIYSNPESESYDLIERTDGRTYERQSLPQKIGDKTIGRVWSFRDITPQQSTEKALRNSERRFRELYASEQRHLRDLALLDRVRNALSVQQDMPTLFKTVVEEIAKTFGYTLVSLYLLQQDTLILQHQVGYERYITHVPINTGVAGRVVRSRRPILIENARTDPDFLYALDDIQSEVCVPLFDEDVVAGVLILETKSGRFLTVEDLDLMRALSVHIGRAITRARLYTRVSDQERYLQEIFYQSPVGLAITELNGQFVQANQALCNMLGYTEEELTKIHFAAITHPDDLSNNLIYLQRMASGQIPGYRFEKRYIRKDGSHMNALLEVSLLQNENTETPNIIAQVLDLSSIKRAEAALLQKQRSESMGVLAGGIAHDFNNLLVAMMAQSSLAQRKLPASSPARKHLERIHKAAESAADLTRQLLAYAGRGQFEIKPISVNQMIIDNIHLFEVAVPKNISLLHKLDPNLPVIMADSGQIQQIIMNLILNGAEAIDHDKGLVEIISRVQKITEQDLQDNTFIIQPTAPGPHIALEVNDNGEGMDAETIERIFDPFFTTKFTGRGLGLAAVVGIVKSHNGCLQVSSSLGKGTTFSIYFPAVSSIDIPANIQHTNRESIMKTKSSNAQPRTGCVLIIDDDQTTQEAVQDILELENISTLSAYNGSEGIEILKEESVQIELVLLDLSMPGISSEETCEGLRRIKNEVPIILCSGYSESEVTSRFHKSHYNGFIHKPFDIDQLLSVVLEYLSF